MTESDEVLVARMVSSRDDAVELLEDLLLDLQRLHHRLDDEVGVLELLERGGEGDPAEQRLLLLLGQLAPRDGARGGVLEVLAPALDALLVDLDAHDVVAVAGEHLRDAGAHGAQSDDADRLEVTCHAAHRAMRRGRVRSLRAARPLTVKL